MADWSTAAVGSRLRRKAAGQRDAPFGCRCRPTMNEASRSTQPAGNSLQHVLRLAASRAKSEPMIEWVPVAVDEKPLLRGTVAQGSFPNIRQPTLGRPSHCAGLAASDAGNENSGYIRAHFIHAQQIRQDAPRGARRIQTIHLIDRPRGSRVLFMRRVEAQHRTVICPLETCQIPATTRG